MRTRSCPSVGLAHGDACPTGSDCAKRYAAQSIDKIFVSKWRNHFSGTSWQRRSIGSSREEGIPARVESGLPIVDEEQKRVGVSIKKAMPMRVYTLAKLLQSMPVIAQIAGPVSEHIIFTRDIILHSLAFYSMRRGVDLSLTLGLRYCECPSRCD